MRHIDRLVEERPQSTANSSKALRNRFWDEMLLIWCDVGGKETGTTTANFLMAATSNIFVARRPDVNAPTPS